uniref:Small ribosomal subunit protein uS3c n=1 Tax=Pteridomonas sp. YPF1301 TaxID=2766739 RepID=A0A7G1MRQ2_9STRA|nr:ribosomal protein S3 [Pteridomonas sp. YPF1301]
MGQKVNPSGFRLIIDKNKNSLWFEKISNYSLALKEDSLIRTFFHKRIKDKNIYKINLKRNISQKFIYITISTIIPKKSIESTIELKRFYIELKKILKRYTSIKLTFIKTTYPKLKPKLFLNFIEKQIKNRIAFYRITQQLLKQLPNKILKGIKIQIAGRLNGIEKARTQWYLIGQLPLHTLKANIKYFKKSIYTKFGVIGIKIWILKKIKINN